MRRRGLLEMAALAALAPLAPISREVVRAAERGGLLVAVQRGRFAYNLTFEM